MKSLGSSESSWCRLVQKGQHPPIQRLRIDCQKCHPANCFEQGVEAFERDADSKAAVEK